MLKAGSNESSQIEYLGVGDGKTNFLFGQKLSHITIYRSFRFMVEKYRKLISPTFVSYENIIFLLSFERTLS